LFVAALFSERSLAEERLVRSEERFRAITEKSSEPVCLMAADGTFLYVSPSMTRLFGYEVDELLGRARWDLVHPDDLESTRASLLECVQRPGQDHMTAFRYRTKDGCWRHLEIRSVNRIDDPSIGGIVAH